jgi:hypothetical protein
MMTVMNVASIKRSEVTGELVVYREIPVDTGYSGRFRRNNKTCLHMCICRSIIGNAVRSSVGIDLSQTQKRHLRKRSETKTMM